MPPAGPRRENTLTYTQKAQIVEERNRRKSEGLSPQNDLALWAKNRFRLDAPPSQPVMSKRLSTSSSLAVEKIGSGQGKQKGENSRDGSLAAWVRDQRAAEVCERWNDKDARASNFKRH